MAISKGIYQSTTEANPFLFPQPQPASDPFSVVSWLLMFVAIFVLAMISYIIYRRNRRFNKSQIGDQWSTLIEGANGEGEKIIKGVIRTIERLEAPNIFIKRENIRPGRGFITEPRELLVAEHRVFDNYDMYIGARDYGKQLFVSWYLVAQPTSFWRVFKRNPLKAIVTFPFILVLRVISSAQGGSSEFFSKFNVFDTEELTAYVTTVHHAVLETTKELMENRHLDFTKVDTKTRGFLNIS